jgi:hypothetical protein
MCLIAFELQWAASFTITTPLNSDRTAFGLFDIISEILHDICQHFQLNRGIRGQLSNKPLSLHSLTPSVDKEQPSVISHSLTHPATYHPIKVTVPFKEYFLFA